MPHVRNTGEGPAPVTQVAGDLEKAHTPGAVLGLFIEGMCDYRSGIVD